MTLPSSGAISLSQVNTELGRSSTATISLGESAVRTLAGVASGAISMSNLYGKSNGATWSPDGGSSAGAPVYLADYQMYPARASVTITCTASATWTWTASGNGTLTATIASGGTGTSQTFLLTGNSLAIRSRTITLSSTAGGVTKYYNIYLEVQPSQ